MLTVASYLHKKTGRSWFAGPRGLYLSVPPGVNAGPAAMELLSDIPELRRVVTYSPAQNQLFIPGGAARTFAKRLKMRDESIRQYCQKTGAPHEERFFGRPYACDPWLARHFRFGGGYAFRGEPLESRAGGATSGRLKRVKIPLLRKKRTSMAPFESATDFKIGTVAVGRDGFTMYRIIKSGKSRRWARVV